MEFNDFKKEYGEKYGLADEEWDNQKKNVILSFIDEDGKVISWYKGMPVFRHRSSESSIQSGQTWICSLYDKQTYFFATGLQKIDSSFMYELKRDQIDEIAAVIWKDQRMTIEPLLEDKYSEVINNRIAAAVDKERKELGVQIENLKEQAHQLEQKDAENKQIIASLEDKINKAPATRQKKDQPRPDMAGPCLLDQAIEVHVSRDGPDAISSPMFDRTRYFVHLSADHRIMLVRPHDDGNVVCMNNSMILSGLSLISQFERPYEMTSEYNPKYGGIQIYL
jgi:hypothetical protein